MDELLLALDEAEDLLTRYLIDNTEGGFEELPEVDDARRLIQDALSIARRLRT